jgi:hydrogenase maturation protein HypF
VQGVVQGVGFRPFVYRLACRFGLKGTVRNNSSGVVIEAEGDSLSLHAFHQALTEEVPSQATIDRIDVETLPDGHYTSFAIAPSTTDHDKNTGVPADLATCLDCLHELNDSSDRRYRYPFLNCMNCGPRFTILTDVPYDRERTTMAGFAMCPDCRAEYENPRDRRFHAQPTACRLCGPRLVVMDPHAHPLVSDEPLAAVIDALRQGSIVAMKGLGGYHLVCDAQNSEAVRELRTRKQRDAKPLAVMAADSDAIGRYCHVTSLDLELLRSPARPIVLLRKRESSPIADEVAPNTHFLGVMLPYTPLHHLLMQQMGRPLVMTSGNVTDEPIAYRDEEAVSRLSHLADYFLMHDRPIHIRCDDSVARVVLGQGRVLRRSRGYVPLPTRLAMPVPMPILACGGQMKNTFCLARSDLALLSHHIGDLDEYRTYRSFVDSIEHFKRLFDIQPEVVVHDLHPGYRSTQYALCLTGVRRIAVQHHHAHIASCMTDNGCEGTVIGVAFDGTGCGSDGHIWGGEFLLAEYGSFSRAAHLEEIPLPGGEQAIRHPWRTAVAYLYHAFGEDMERLDLDLLKQQDSRARMLVGRMIRKGIHSPLTSSAGRLFDGVAALVGLRDEVEYEAQAAIELEMLAEGQAFAKESYPFHILDHRPMVVGTQGIIKGIVADVLAGEPADTISNKFHTTVADIILETCRRIRHETGVRQVALSGGVFQNARLLTESFERLSADGFVVFTHRAVPPHDGGLALGQIAIATAVLSQG